LGDFPEINLRQLLLKQALKPTMKLQILIRVPVENVLFKGL
jgi:hypothetical protein